MVVATLLGALLPGAGHLLMGARRLGCALLLGELVGGAAAAWHLASGLQPFESPQGSFLFGVLLRGLLCLHGYAAIDLSFRASDEPGGEGPGRRLALLCHLLLPGAGYVVARLWLRAAPGIGISGLIVVLASRGHHRLLDLIYVGAQLALAAGLYHQLRLREARRLGDTLPPPPRPGVPAAQIVALVAFLGVTVGCGYVVERRMPSYPFEGLTPQDVRVTPSRHGVRVQVPRLELSLIAAGEGWSAEEHRPGILFAARHAQGASLLVGAEPIPPFVRADRYVEHLRRRMVDEGFTHQRTLPLLLHGVPAVQLRFTGMQGPSHPIDQWAIAVPRHDFAYVLMVNCHRRQCPALAPQLERTRDSFRVP
ncbi:MAG: hypothetical protein IT371_01135 [Deltaproteobacteria bacterium]|nr:hypothetical protein [Deltaproteobacteria bacterium]